jgi:Methyltransferase domain
VIRRRRRRRSERETLGLTRLEPVSRAFGYDRGRPIDRWYIERFLAAHAEDVRGRVLEVAESTYTELYGGDRVTRSDILIKTPHPDATVVGDLTTGEGIPSEAFDCFICTQTLTYTYDIFAAVRRTRELLAPGGVLLATVPGITQYSPEDRRQWGEWWRFTLDSASRLFEEAYGARNVKVEAHGNVLVAASFLYGFASEELTTAELSHRDDQFDFLMTVRAVKRD